MFRRRKSGVVAEGCVDADLPAVHAAGDGLSGFELHGIDAVHIQEWGEARDICLHSPHGRDVRDWHCFSNCCYTY